MFVIMVTYGYYTNPAYVGDHPPPLQRVHSFIVLNMCITDVLF